MQMHVGRKVLAFGLTALVVGASAGSAFAASSGSSAAATSTPVTVVAGASSTALPPIQKLTVAQVAQKLGVPTKALVAALADAKASVAKAGVSGDAAKDLTIKVLVKDLHISPTAAEWAADELLGGYIVTK